MFRQVGIASIEAIDIHEDVFNFAVEEDESYVANGVVNHNCRCYPSPTPLGPVAPPMRWRPKQTARVIKSMSTRSPMQTQLALLEHLVAEVAPPAPPAIAFDLEDVEKSLAAVLGKKPQKAKDGKLPEPDAAPPPFVPPTHVDLAHPGHLNAMGHQVRAHLQSLPVGSKAHAHVKRQYDALRQAEKQWYATHGHAGDKGGKVKLPPVPACAPGGAAHLKTPEQFELAIAHAEHPDELIELGHYLDAYMRRHRKAGVAWDHTWATLKQAIAGWPAPGAEPVLPLGDDTAEGDDDATD